MISPEVAVTVYTDGACLGNPGAGGYGAVLFRGAIRTEMSGGFRKTTNNRMEIMAAIAGLEGLDQRCSVAVYTDSKYLENGITRGWALKWRSNGWMDKGEVRLNWDLWSRLLVLCEQHSVQFHWVRGHAGNAENERCDSIAVKAAQQVGLPADEGYETPTPPAVPCALAKSTQLCFFGLE